MIISISGLNNTDNPAPGIPIAKSLKNNHILIGLSYDSNEPGNYQNLFDKVYMMPYPSMGFSELKLRLEYIKNKENIDIIIPNLDAELPLYIKFKNEINAMGIQVLLPTQESFEARNKNKLDILSKNLQIQYPKAYEVSSIADIYTILELEHFPLMIKGNYYKSYKVFSIEEAINSFTEIANEWGFPVLVQRCVEGEEINLVGVADNDSNLVGAVSIKKLTTTDIGKIWMGITIHNEQLLQMAKDFVSITSWNGPFELECMVNPTDMYMIEINPRFPAWVYFATDIGVNLPQMLVDIIANKSVKANFEYPANKMYVRFVDELVTDFDNYKQMFTQKELTK